MSPGATFPRLLTDSFWPRTTPGPRGETLCAGFPETCFSQNFTQNSGASLRDQRRNSRRFEPLPTTLPGRPPSWALLHLSDQHFQIKSLT